MNNIKNKKKKLSNKQLIDQRKAVLLEILSMNKLEYKPYGDHYSHIIYGTPDIKVILEKEVIKSKIRNDRMLKLAAALEKINIPLDETLESCYKYVNGLYITENLDKIIKDIEIEYFFKYNTNYTELLNSGMSKNEATETALKEYLNKNKKIDNNIYNNVNSKLNLSFN